MKLYYAKGACSLSPHIVLHELEIPVDLIFVDLKEHKTEHGDDYYGVNPKGYVPALRLDDGEILTEGVAIIQYLADQKPEKKLIPACGTMERYRLIEWLTFISSEIHKAFGPLWGPNVAEDVRKSAIDKITRRFAYVDKELTGKEFLMGEQFTIADAYLFTIVNWSFIKDIDLAPYPNLKAYYEKIKMRPHVQEALKMEGLI